MTSVTSISGTSKMIMLQKILTTVTILESICGRLWLIN